MPGLKTNEVKLVSENGLQQKSITIDNNGIPLFNGIQIPTVSSPTINSPTISSPTFTGIANFASGGLNVGSGQLVVDSSGRVIKPYQPTFYAYDSGSNIRTTTGAVVFNSTIINVGSHYNITNGAFTAPISGYYEFNAVLLYRGGTTAANGEYSFYKNGVNVSIRSTAYCSINVSTGHTPCSSMVRLYLSAGDYVQVYITVVNTGMDWYCGQNLSFFTGRFIG